MSRSDRPDSPAAMWGAMLRHYREKVGLSQARLAETINFSDAQVASVETGRRTPSEDFAQLCDRATNADDALIRLFEMFLGRSGFMPGFEEWPKYERKATMLRGWESTLVPGLLQIPEYIEVILERNKIDIEARLSRQTVLARENRPEIRYVIDERVLRHRVGDAAIMSRQLAHLEQVVSEGLAHVQVKDSDVLPGTSGAFGLATVDGRTVGYEESTTQVWLVAGDQDIHRQEVVYHKLLAEAETPARSLERIRKIRKELWKN